MIHGIHLQRFFMMMIIDYVLVIVENTDIVWELTLIHTYSYSNTHFMHTVQYTVPKLLSK